MRIHWYMPTKSMVASELKESPLACMRLRSYPSILGLQKKGFQVSFGDECADDMKLDCAIFGKLGQPMDVEERSVKWTKVIDKLKQNGVVVIMDYTDNHLQISSNMTNFYIENIKKVDAVIVPSPKMKEYIKYDVNGKIYIIDDAIEVDILTPVSKENNIKEALWFGAKSNLKYLVEYIKKIDYPERLNINILIDKKGIDWLREMKITVRKDVKISISADLWSVNKLVEVAKKCDFCLIPSDVQDQRKSGAGSNRLITSLALGLPVMATNLSSYEPHSKYYLDIEKNSIESMMKNLEFMQDKVLDAQNSIINNFSIEKIGEEWSRIVENCINIMN